MIDKQVRWAIRTGLDPYQTEFDPTPVVFRRPGARSLRGQKKLYSSQQMLTILEVDPHPILFSKAPHLYLSFWPS